MSTNNPTESTPKSSIWRGNDVAPEQGRKLVIMTIKEQLSFAKLDKDNDFVNKQGGILTSAVWKWTYLEELLSIADYEAITSETQQERVKQCEVEREQRLKKAHQAEQEIKKILQQFLSDITGGKAQVESVGIIKVRKD